VINATITQPLWTGGRLNAGVDKANANVAVSLAEIEKSQHDIAMRVIDSYGNWLAAYSKQHAWGKSLAAHERLRDQVKRRMEQGVAAQNELTLAQGRFEATKAEIAAVDAEAAMSLATLAQIVGRELLSADLIAGLAEAPTHTQDLQTMQDQALAVSAELKRAQAGMTVVDADIALRYADFWPELSLRYEYQSGDLRFANAEQSQIYLALNSRFGAGLSSISNLRMEQERRATALADIEIQRRTVQEQISSAFALVESFKSRLLALQSSLEKTQIIMASYSRQFLAGRKTWLDVMNAAREQASAEVQLADARASYHTVSWRLHLYLGAGSLQEQTALHPSIH
jgi:adhesin transport system outer membrane protein